MKRLAVRGETHFDAHAIAGVDWHHARKESEKRHERALGRAEARSELRERNSSVRVERVSLEPTRRGGNGVFDAATHRD